MCVVLQKLKSNGSKNHFPKNSTESNTETPKSILGIVQNFVCWVLYAHFVWVLLLLHFLDHFNSFVSGCIGKRKERSNEDSQASKPSPLIPISSDSRLVSILVKIVFGQSWMELRLLRVGCTNILLSLVLKINKLRSELIVSSLTESLSLASL